jgi:hypothetical protein
MFDDLKLNWSSMTPVAKRKLITYIVVGILVVSTLIVGPMMNAKNTSETSSDNDSGLTFGKKKGSDNTIKLGGGPNEEWLERSMTASAAGHRNQIKKELDILQETLASYRDDSTIGFSDIKKTLVKIENLSSQLQLSIAKESAQRRSSDKFIIGKIDGVNQGHLGLDGESNIPISTQSGLLQPSSQGSGMQGDRKMNPFDMLAVARASGISLNTSTPNYAASQLDSNQPIIPNDTGGAVKQEKPLTRKGDPLPVNTSSRKSEPPKRTLVKIATGSLIRARLVNGLNAIIANTADTEKLIVLAKLTDPILMPNRKKVSLRGCSIMGGGKGDLSTERVYIQTTILSCIGPDDVLYEGVVKSNGIGEDGVLGLRGRPVTRDGALILQSASTGLIQGFAEAFSDSATRPQVVTNTDGSYSLPSVDFVGTSALASGIDGGLSQMVDRANSILDQIFPILEVDAGRTIEFVVQESFELKEI